MEPILVPTKLYVIDKKNSYLYNIHTPQVQTVLCPSKSLTVPRTDSKQVQPLSNARPVDKSPKHNRIGAANILVLNVNEPFSKPVASD